MLSRMKMSIDGAMKQYHTIGKEVFAHPRLTAFKGNIRPRYKSKRMKKALHAVLAYGLKDEKRRTGKLTKKIALKNENDYACHT